MARQLKSEEGGIVTMKPTSHVLIQAVSENIVIRHVQDNWRLTTLIDQTVDGIPYSDHEDIIIAEDWSEFLFLIEEHFG